MRSLLILLATLAPLLGSELHPIKNREVLVTLPDPTNVPQLTLFIATPPPASEDTDLRVYWLSAGAEEFQLEYAMPGLRGWFKASDLSIEEEGPWLIYYGAPAFYLAGFQAGTPAGVLGRAHGIASAV
jgi:hypothetical protein